MSENFFLNLKSKLINQQIKQPKRKRKPRDVFILFCSYLQSLSNIFIIFNRCSAAVDLPSSYLTTLIPPRSIGIKWNPCGVLNIYKSLLQFTFLEEKLFKVEARNKRNCA